jgi:glycosyltransferase involved in cell wall biosynthesis
MTPLVSIIIPAYNAAATLPYTLESATGQTWPRKEIIVVDDGSTDDTAAVADRFASKGVKVVSIKNRGLAGAVNYGYSKSQGDYIQELDADDILGPDKIERQLAARRVGDSTRLLLSSPWAHFYYRTSRARFVRNAFWQDLSPVEWLMRKLGENLHMQNAMWLVSRELAEATGGWDERLDYDQDGEYYARLVSLSAGTRFVPEGSVFYRLSGSHRVSFIGDSDKKKESLLRSMKLHVQYIRGLEDSDRVRRACLAYFQTWFSIFHPSRPDLAAELQSMAAQFQGELVPPQLPIKYAWMQPLVGSQTATRMQTTLPQLKSGLISKWDKAMFWLETRYAQ